MLAINTPAPDFTLPDHDGTLVAWRDFRAGTVGPVFHPKDASPVYNRQLNDYPSPFADVCANAAQLPAMSTDSVAEHRAFFFLRDLRFSLLSANAGEHACPQTERASYRFFEGLLT